jgi:hypothetical protein
LLQLIQPQTKGSPDLARHRRKIVLAAGDPHDGPRRGPARVRPPRGGPAWRVRFPHLSEYGIFAI